MYEQVGSSHLLDLRIQSKNFRSHRMYDICKVTKEKNKPKNKKKKQKKKSSLFFNYAKKKKKKKKNIIF
jgi:hypothetical protein